MTDRLPRSVIEPVNPKLNVSRNAKLPHSPGIRVGDYIFLSGMGPVDPVTGGRNLGPIADRFGRRCATWRICSNPPALVSTASSR
jgi:enamine deaminase RidA (YjgF/YER057c/UK114 family)